MENKRSRLLQMALAFLMVLTMVGAVAYAQAPATSSNVQNPERLRDNSNLNDFAWAEAATSARWQCPEGAAERTHGAVPCRILLRRQGEAVRTVLGAWEILTFNPPIPSGTSIRFRTGHDNRYGPTTGRSAAVSLIYTTDAAVNSSTTWDYLTTISTAWEPSNPNRIYVNNIVSPTPVAALMISRGGLRTSLNPRWYEVAPINQVPTVINLSANPPSPIELPTNSVTLTGSVTDPDALPLTGRILSGTWSGALAGSNPPVLASFSNVSFTNNLAAGAANTATATAQSLTAGTYRFTLTGNDGGGGVPPTASIDVTVNPAAAPANVAPTVTSATATTTTTALPPTGGTINVTLAGAANDPDGPAPLTPTWSVNPTTGVSIPTPGSLNTTATITEAGTYTFSLTAWDAATPPAQGTLAATALTITRPTRTNFTAETLEPNTQTEPIPASIMPPPRDGFNPTRGGTITVGSVTRADLCVNNTLTEYYVREPGSGLYFDATEAARELIGVYSITLDPLFERCNTAGTAIEPRGGNTPPAFQPNTPPVRWFIIAADADANGEVALPIIARDADPEDITITVAADENTINQNTRLVRVSPTTRLGYSEYRWFYNVRNLVGSSGSEGCDRITATATTATGNMSVVFWVVVTNPPRQRTGWENIPPGACALAAQQQ